MCISRFGIVDESPRTGMIALHEMGYFMQSDHEVQRQPRKQQN